MAGVRRVVDWVVRDNDLLDRSIDELFVLAHTWLAHHHSEDKLAAVLLLSEHLTERLHTEHDSQFSAPLASGDLADWNVRCGVVAQRVSSASSTSRPSL